MIPKRIFYVWGAHEPKRRDVLACMQTWRQTCPEYQIVEINEESSEYFNFKKELESNAWFRTVYKRKIWAYVSDYIRLKVLHDNGGIYLDTDVSVLKSFDNLLNNPCFVGMQCSKLDGHDDWVEPAILGGQKGNRFLKSVLDFYDKTTPENIWNTPIYILPDVFKIILDRMYGRQSYPLKKDQVVIRYSDVTIYPERFFIPFRWTETFYPECIEEDTYTIHWWGSSWVKPEVLLFLDNKHSKEGLEFCHKRELEIQRDIAEKEQNRKNLHLFSIRKYFWAKVLSKITVGSARKNYKKQYQEQKKLYRAIKKGKF